MCGMNCPLPPLFLLRRCCCCGCCCCCCMIWCCHTPAALLLHGMLPHPCPHLLPTKGCQAWPLRSPSHPWSGARVIAMRQRPPAAPRAPRRPPPGTRPAGHPAPRPVKAGWPCPLPAPFLTFPLAAPLAHAAPRCLPPCTRPRRPHLPLPPSARPPVRLCSGVVLRVLFHPKQLMLVSAGDDAEVRVWDLVTRSCAAGERATQAGGQRLPASGGGCAAAGAGLRAAQGGQLLLRAMLLPARRRAGCRALAPFRLLVGRWHRCTVHSNPGLPSCLSPHPTPPLQCSRAIFPPSPPSASPPTDGRC